MIVAALIATWWALAGVAIGLSQANTYPGPQDAVRWAALWAVGWPLLWLTEDRS